MKVGIYARITVRSRDNACLRKKRRKKKKRPGQANTKISPSISAMLSEEENKRKEQILLRLCDPGQAKVVARLCPNWNFPSRV